MTARFGMMLNYGLDKIILVDIIVVLRTQKNREPKHSMPNGMICDLEELELSEQTFSEQSLQDQENYSKVSLVLFHPFCSSNMSSLTKMNAHGTKICISCHLIAHQISFLKKEKRFFKIYKTTFKQENARYQFKLH